MSKIGKTPISIPDQVQVEVKENEVLVAGLKGQLTAPLFKHIKVEIQNGEVRVSRDKNDKQTCSNHGLVRSLINNHIIGVTKGYKKTLKMVGTGYRAKKKGQGLELTVGYSHPVTVDPVPGIILELEGDDTIYVSGIDKQKVGQVAANIRAIKPPEVYKGKGIRYKDEIVRLKPGKAAVE
jgi:large subunit ribosomal protein L6